MFGIIYYSVDAYDIWFLMLDNFFFELLFNSLNAWKNEESICSTIPILGILLYGEKYGSTIVEDGQFLAHIIFFGSLSFGNMTSVLVKSYSLKLLLYSVINCLNEHFVCHIANETSIMMCRCLYFYDMVQILKYCRCFCLDVKNSM